MNIVIPMAGRGIRTASFTVPKPLIKFDNKTMLEMAVESLGIDGNYIFIQRDYENHEWNDELELITRRLVPNAKIIKINYVTEGPACSSLLAAPLLLNDLPLIITNCDQIMHWNPAHFESFINSTECDGVVVTYNSDTPKNSYVKLDKNGIAIEFAEKKIISNDSLNGIHYWKRGTDFIDSTISMIQNNDTVNGEYYIAPSYNYLINAGKKITNYHINKTQHFAVGTTDDINYYLREFI
jgi:NDP-sugar pyrophosphorylase family protein